MIETRQTPSPRNRNHPREGNHFAFEIVVLFFLSFNPKKLYLSFKRRASYNNIIQ